VKIGDVAPDFTVQSLDGKRSIHVSDFRGRRVLIYAWASW
jgi:peroxiredoxin